MNMEIIDLSESQVEELENALDAYDKKYITYKVNGSISIGISHEGTLVAGLDAFSWQGKEFYQAKNRKRKSKTIQAKGQPK